MIPPYRLTGNKSAKLERACFLFFPPWLLHRRR